MELILETRDQANETPVVGAVALTPLPDADYWSYRVRLSDGQAVLGFPKFSTVGIGFAVEDESWNTNLPYHCPTDKILDHIIDNKGDEEIDDADVREAIRMIQLAVIDERAVTRREAFNVMFHATPSTDVTAGPCVPFAMFDQALMELEAAMREVTMLRAEADHPRAVPVPPAPETFPGASPIPDGTRGFVTLLLRLGVPAKDGRVLAFDGKWEMPQDTPIHQLVDETVGHSPSEVVGRIVGLWPLDGDVYAIGVAPPELAEDLNMGRLALGADLKADIVEGGDPTHVTIGSGHVLGARVRRMEDFAWATS